MYRVAGLSAEEALRPWGVNLIFLFFCKHTLVIMFISLQFLLVNMEFFFFRFGNFWTYFCFCSYFLSLKRSSLALAKCIFYRYVTVSYYALINESTRLAMSSGPLYDSVKVYSKASSTFSDPNSTDWFLLKFAARNASFIYSFIRGVKLVWILAINAITATLWKFKLIDSI